MSWNEDENGGGWGNHQDGLMQMHRNLMPYCPRCTLLAFAQGCPPANPDNELLYFSITLARKKN